MSRNRLLCAFVFLFFPAVAQAQLADPIPGPIPTSPLTVRLEQLASGLNSPVWGTHTGDNSGRLIVVDQTGQLRVIQNGGLLPTPMLDVSPGNAAGVPPIVNLNAGFDERGLLGLAFHPEFNNAASAGFGKLYTYSSEPVGRAADFPLPVAATVNHQAVIREWMISAANPNLVDPTRVREILRIDEPQSNHNGGALDFGPDGYLYISLGDGGGADDQGNGHLPTGNAQSLDTVLGKVLRIDINGDDFPAVDRNYAVPATNPFVGAAGIDEIFAYGLRNPFRMSFDSLTGTLVLGDVGQNDVEEVDIITAGANYGWRIKEGTFLFDPRGESGPNSSGIVTANSPGAPAGLTDPIFQYDDDEGISVIGGFVYRGSMLPALYGKYIFGEHNGTAAGVNARLFVGDLATGEFQELLPAGVALSNYVLKGFGEDQNGELYLMVSVAAGPFGGNGFVLRLVPEPGSLALTALGGVVLGAGRRTRRPTRRSTLRAWPPAPGARGSRSADSPSR